MDTAVATPEPVTPTASTPDPSPQVETPKPSESISDHAASFGPQAQRENEEATVDPRPSRRAQSHRAGPDDVPRIQELTKKWRAEETARKALEAKHADLEAQIAALKKPAETPKPFDDKAPKLEDFEKEDDPYGAFITAKVRYDLKKEQATAAQTDHQQAEQERQRADVAKVQKAYFDRAQAFAKTTVDFDAVVSKSTTPTTPLLTAALLRDERGPEFVYTLARRPELLAELNFLTRGQDVSEDALADLRRVLASRISGASTGSPVTASTSYTPPKPPNPVRTGPIQTVDAPPEQPTSIADHAKYFGKKR